MSNKEMIAMEILKLVAPKVTEDCTEESTVKILERYVELYQHTLNYINELLG